MKRWMAGLLAMLMLYGCSVRQEMPDTGSADPAQPISQTPELGLYVPDTELERQSTGAVRTYQLQDPDCFAVASMGSGILLFSKDAGKTRLQYYTENNAPYTALLSCSVTAEQTWILSNGVAYYDESRNSVVFLDTILQEKSSVTMPKDMLGRPVLSPDGQKIFYCAADGIRTMEFRTGITRLLRQLSEENAKLQGVYFDGTVLLCRVGVEPNAAWLMLSADTGETLDTQKQMPRLVTSEQTWAARWVENGQVMLLCGEREGQAMHLKVQQSGEAALLPQLDGIVLYRMENDGIRLSFYDISEGTQVAAAELPGLSRLLSFAADPQRELIWFLAEQDGAVRLFSWQWQKNLTQDQTDYREPYVSESEGEPDSEALKQCAEQAQALGKKYGCRILIDQDAVQTEPEDALLEPENRVNRIRGGLQVLERAMARIPAEIWEQLDSNPGDMLQIALVKSISNSRGVQQQNAGIQFWNDGEACIAVTLGEELERQFYHQLFHVMDNRVLTGCVIYDEWDSMNPRGFAYDYSYTKNAERTDERYVQDDENRAFISLFSMSYPREDRATIFENAMLPEGTDCFRSWRMQEKLSVLCRGIRRAFALEEDGRVFAWEQYLEQPLAPGA